MLSFIHCCYSFIAVFVMLFLHFRAIFPCHRHSTLASQTREDLHQFYHGYFKLLLLFRLPRVLRFWVGNFYPQAFFTLRSFPTFLTQPAFIKASLGAGSFSLKFAGLHADLRNTDPAHLFVWFTAIHNLDVQKNSFLNRTKYYHELLVIKSLVYLLLTHFELFSLALCKDYKKHFEQDLYCL